MNGDFNETSKLFTAWWRSQQKNLSVDTYESIIDYTEYSFIREEFLKNPSIPDYLKKYCIIKHYYESN